MELKELSDIAIAGKRVLLRVAYDVPIAEKNGKRFVVDDTRIRSSLKTLRYLLQKKCRVVILTWLGRPGGKRVAEYALTPVAKTLSGLIKKPVKKLDAVTGDIVNSAVGAMKPGEIVMLENVRFYPQEEYHDQRLSDELAKLADVCVFEAFAQSHRDYPSTTGVLARMNSVCGFDMTKETHTIAGLLEKPAYPFVVILGGAKISDKIDLIKNLMNVADAILIGGALSHNFLKASGVKIAASLVEGQTLLLKRERQKLYRVAEEIMKTVGDTYVSIGPGINIPKLVLPLDLVATRSGKNFSSVRVIELEGRTALPWNWMYMDIGPKTRALFSRIIKKAKVVFWNGPLGYIEEEKFAEGSIEVAKAISESKCRSIVGGGDTESFLRQYRLTKKFDYVSTGGGAVLELLSGNELPVLKYLKK